MPVNSEQSQLLRERFNPDGSILRRHQLRMLEMLRYIDKVCRENGIRYWLSSGTCLGAVRHGGFIPWDDDVDIEMLKADYLKLKPILEKDNKYYFQTHKSDSFYIAPYAKLRDKHSHLEEHGQDRNYKYKGIYIDIFILEPGSKWIRLVYEKLMVRIMLFGSKLKSNNLFFRGLKSLFFFSINLIRPLDRLFTSINTLRHTYGSGFCDKIRHKDKLLPTVDVDFEGEKFPVPRDVDFYLSSIYGKDYNELPDLDSIHPHTTEIEIQ